jgi:hypothetical protein
MVVDLNHQSAIGQTGRRQDGGVLDRYREVRRPLWPEKK